MLSFIINLKQTSFIYIENEINNFHVKIMILFVLVES